MKQLLIKLGLWEEENETYIGPANDNQILVDQGWYETAMKHYCGTCEQWFKTASVATHNRFKHKDA